MITIIYCFVIVFLTLHEYCLDDGGDILVSWLPVCTSVNVEMRFVQVTNLLLLSDNDQACPTHGELLRLGIS